MESRAFNVMDDEKLIEVVRNYPVIYKLSDKNYKDNCIKDNVWKEISQSIGKNVNDCKTRWRTIRDSYKKNLKKRRLGTGSAATTKSKYNDDSLSFLDNIENERRTTSNISVEKKACNDNTNYSEMAVNDSFDQTEEIEPEKELLLKSSEPLLDMPIDDKLPNTEINHSLIDSFTKPCEKKTTRRAQDKILDEIKKGREERLAALREMKQQESIDPIQTFFKSMASTVSMFPPESVVEAKMRIFNIVSEMELRLLKTKATTSTPPVETMTSTSTFSSNLQVPTILADESSCSTTMSSVSDISNPTPSAKSNFFYLKYLEEY
ncbi:uncharacterized protein LOC132938721 [Metopolophium dirhodum]|uniref:uncharacterized protein LOC132938721 n=1 Tax=Metopolophium dirhodum TaxID=44670 RepID=UPI00299076DA|nr:uncharacterized protein LOC132938721 [Metopolophium dirhodum]XP_060861709.1 uncharacterized protein LOC132938721 [Metopolophium dirhodum]